MAESAALVAEEYGAGPGGILVIGGEGGGGSEEEKNRYVFEAWDHVIYFRTDEGGDGSNLGWREGPRDLG